MIDRLREVLADESGAVLKEYSLVLALLAVGAIVGLTAMASTANTSFNNSTSAMQTYSDATPVP